MLPQLNAPVDLSIIAVFFGGLVSFLSPCIIPIVPSYLSYISGVVVKDGYETKDKRKVLYHTTCFIIGFGFAFALLQLLFFYFANFVAKFLYTPVTYFIFGGVIVIMGLHLLGIFIIPHLHREVKGRVEVKKKGFFTSVFLGFAFGFGWSPCVGPILATVLAYASAQETLYRGLFLMLVYTTGLGLPFLVFAYLLDKPAFFKLAKKYIFFSNKAAGIILIVIGALLAFNQLSIFNNFGLRNHIIDLFK